MRKHLQGLALFTTALIAGALPVFAQPSCTVIADTIYSVGVATPILMTGTIDLALGYSAADGSFIVTQSAARQRIVAGALSTCLAPGSYSAQYSVLKPAPMTGSTTFTRYWVVPSGGGPFTLSAVETSTPTTPLLTIALSQIGPGGATDGQCMTWSAAAGAWIPAPCGSGSGPISSVFGRTGAVTANSGDYTSAKVTEATNLYFTNGRAVAAMAGLYESPLTFSLPFVRTVNTLTLNLWGSGSRPVAANALGVSGNCVQWTLAGLGDTGSACGTSGGGGANALGFYLVNQASNAPANAINLGSLTTGIQTLSVSGGVATPGTINGTAYQPVMANSSIGVPNGTATATLGVIVDGDCASATGITLTGAALGDVVFAGVSVALPAGVHATAAVTGANTASVMVCNLSEAPVTVASATYKVALLR